MQASPYLEASSTLGPVADIQGGVEVTGFELGAKFSAGVTATIPDTAALQVDLLSPWDNELSSWIPRFAAEQPSVEVKGSAIMETFLDPGLKLEGEALRKLSPFIQPLSITG